MAGAARWGLKPTRMSAGVPHGCGLNGRGGPLGFETTRGTPTATIFLWLNGRGGPLGFETPTTKSS